MYLILSHPITSLFQLVYPKTIKNQYINKN